MCGIVGYKFFSSYNPDYASHISSAIGKLNLRGPDSHGLFVQESVGLGQTRLSIIDPSEKGDQPMFDSSGRYVLIFNGEIYNHKELRVELPNQKLKSTSDTEVLLYLLIHQGVECLPKLNGFFAFAFYDIEKDHLILARDQIGIKPFHYYQDQHHLVFSSEMKALLEFPLPKELDKNSLYWYLKLNYLPGNSSMLQGFRKLEPGNYLSVTGSEIQQKGYVTVEKNENKISYDQSQKRLIELLEASVNRRLMSDVPLGSFLSGGLDSSAIVSLATRQSSHFSTFSIGYKEHPFFDETAFAELVAEKFKTNHTTFLLTNEDLLEEIGNILSYIDEPFADSSAIPTYIVSKRTSQHVKVALSGDGADELFGGYYKHLALNRSLNPNLSDRFIAKFSPVVRQFPMSRSGKFGNVLRRIDRFGSMLKMNLAERYWYLASLTNDPSGFMREQHSAEHISKLKHRYLPQVANMNDYFDADLSMLLPSDMLTKVDLMSMANSLEVRVPFLDKEVVSFARSLEIQYKLKGTQRKRVLHDAFKSILPKEIYHRPKKGFEVPLLQWMRNELLEDLDKTLFDKGYLEDQGIFDPMQVIELRARLFSSNPHDVHAIIWALYVFQKWYLNYFN